VNEALTGLDAQVLRSALDAAADGIVICEASGDRSVLYANAAFAQLTGYGIDELIGSNLRRLQGAERDQEGVRRLREALAHGESCRAVVRNFRKDGTPFWNEVIVHPIRDATGRVTHFAGFHREAADRPRTGERPAAGLPGWIRDDRLTGLASRVYFEEALQREWASARRLGQQVALLVFDVDHLAAYNETYERGGGDSCIRRVGHAIGAAFRRSSDLVARIEGGTFYALVPGMTEGAAAGYASEVVRRVIGMRIHHPRAATRYVSISAGVAAAAPPRDQAPTVLVHAACAALQRAKQNGRNRVESAGHDAIPGSPPG
jgi:diguanylate cyclase (GGDEF)-like protein/PAS domain S-box-containing protein